MEVEVEGDVKAAALLLTQTFCTFDQSDKDTNTNKDNDNDKDTNTSLTREMSKQRLWSSP